MSASDKKKLRKEQNAAALTEKQLAEQKESKKLKTYTISFVAVLALVVVVALVVGLVTSYVNSGILQRNTDAVAFGDSTLSNADLNFFFMDQIQSDYNNWYNSYADNTTLFVQWLYGLDITKPLSQQVYDEEAGTTFADYYTDLAIENAKNVYAIYNLAKAAGETLTDAQKSELELTIDYMDLYASMYGYSSTESYLQALYGVGATLEGYSKYLEIKTLATNYAQNHYNSIDIAKSDITARNKENYEAFSSFDYSVFFVDINDFLPCNDEAVSSDHTHTAEELTSARKAAEEAAKALVASEAKTTAELDAAIAAYEAYKGNESAKSGERTGYTLDQVTTAQGNWLKSADRQIGDLEMLVKESSTTDAEGNVTTTIDGYHVMLFLGRNDNEQKLVNVRHILSSFKGGTTDENGNTVYTVAEMEGAKTVIEAVLSDWQANGGTVEAFDALAKEKSDDSSAKENGGLYEGVYPGAMTTNFNDWCFEEGRKAGDYGIVESNYGYHLIYFVGHTDTTYREMLIEDALRNEAYTDWYNTQLENVTVTELNTQYLSLDRVIAGY